MSMAGALCFLEPVEEVGEHALDMAHRTCDAALRCHYWENGDVYDWANLTDEEKAAMVRPPTLHHHGVASGAYYVYHDGVARPCSRENAFVNLFVSFQS
jgi:hypothetical protein